MNKLISVLFFVAVLAMGSCNKWTAPAPYGAIPSQAQLDWQEMEYYMFIHFGPNTFTNVEWGDGQEDPKVFDPSEVDCMQWAVTAKAAGMKGIIITAKHHDGFCLWPSQYSTHTVRESNWKNGQGDVLKELSAACKAYDLKLGVYLSPWDQNHPAYGTNEYNEIFANTLNEVLTNYGDIFEVWFDGANGEGADGKTQVYDWPLFHETVYKNHPEAVIFSDIGPGCRWMGNEAGHAGETNWSRLNIEGFAPGKNAPARDTLSMGNVYGKNWIPAETDVSIRPGWFYSASTDDKVKSLQHLVQIYYNSIGRNSNLLLNVPPARTGKIHSNDSIRLVEFKEFIDTSFKNDLALHAKVVADDTRKGGDMFSANNLTDGNKDTYWATDDEVLHTGLIIELGETEKINRLLLQEYISLGQRVARFSATYWNETTEEWEPLTSGTTIGYKRILAFPTVSTNRIRIDIEESLASPVLNSIGLYLAPEFLSEPVISRNKEGMVFVNCETKDPQIYYTLDGSEPNSSSLKYNAPFGLKDGGVIKAIAVVNEGNEQSVVIQKILDVAPAKWNVQHANKLEAEKTIDGNEKTAGKFPVKSSLIIDFGENLILEGFTYTPLTSGVAPNIYKYNLYVGNSLDKLDKIKSNATFSNIKNNPITQEVYFDKKQNVRYIKLEPVEMTNTNENFTVAEIGVITNRNHVH